MNGKTEDGKSDKKVPRVVSLHPKNTKN